jgi:hypothetical protein
MCRRKSFHHYDGHIRRGELKPENLPETPPAVGIPSARVRG